MMGTFKLNEIYRSLLNELSGQEIYDKYYRDIPQITFNAIIMSDPKTVFDSKGNAIKIGAYSKLLLFLYKKGNLKTEDLPKAREYLGYAYKHNVPLDIKVIRSLSDIYNLVSKYIVQDKKDLSTILQSLGEKEYKLLHNGKDWFIFTPLTERAACYLGANTEWCTTWGKHSLNPEHRGRENYFTRYDTSDTLYIMINKQNNYMKFQFHIKERQFMDRNDRQIDVDEFLMSNPELLYFYLPILNDPNNTDLNQIKFIPIIPRVYKGEFFKRLRNFVKDNDNDFVLELIDDIGYETGIDSRFYTNDGNLKRIYVEYPKIKVKFREYSDELNGIFWAIRELNNKIYDYEKQLREVVEDSEGNGLYDEEIVKEILLKFYDYEKTVITTRNRRLTKEKFIEDNFSNISSNKNFTETYIREFVNLNEDAYKAKFNGVLKKIESLIEFDEYNTINIDYGAFLAFLMEKGIKEFNEETTFDEMIYSFILENEINYTADEILEFTYSMNYEYPEYDPEGNDRFSLDITDILTDDINETRAGDDFDYETTMTNISKFKQMKEKYFNNSNTFENDLVIIRINGHPYYNEGVVNVTIHDKKNNHTNTGNIKLDSLPTYMANYKLFESFISFNRILKG